MEIYFSKSAFIETIKVFSCYFPREAVLVPLSYIEQKHLYPISPLEQFTTIHDIDHIIVPKVISPPPNSWNSSNAIITVNMELFNSSVQNSIKQEIMRYPTLWNSDWVHSHPPIISNDYMAGTFASNIDLGGHMIPHRKRNRLSGLDTSISFIGFYLTRYDEWRIQAFTPIKAESDTLIKQKIVPKIFNYGLNEGKENFWTFLFSGKEKPFWVQKFKENLNKNENFFDEERLHKRPTIEFEEEIGEEDALWHPSDWIAQYIGFVKVISDNDPKVVRALSQPFYRGNNGKCWLEKQESFLNHHGITLQKDILARGWLRLILSKDNTKFILALPPFFPEQLPTLIYSYDGEMKKIPVNQCFPNIDQWSLSKLFETWRGKV